MLRQKSIVRRILDLELLGLHDDITEISFNFSTKKLRKTLDATTPILII